MIDVIQQAMDADLTRRLALTLLHTLWQAAVIAVVLRCTWLRWMPARACRSRYRATLGAFVVVLLAALVTFSILGWEPASAGPPTAASVADSAMTQDAGAPSATSTPVASSTGLTSTGGSTSEDGPASAIDWTWWLIAAWSVGFALMLVRAVAALLDVHVRLLRGSEPIAGELAEQVGRLRERLGVARSVEVRLCERITSPAVVGAVWPTLLLPASAMTGLTPQQLQMVIAHELAHVRRHDYLVNLLQLLVEAALFFNPAVWWLSRQLRIEREACCDAVAVEAIGGGERRVMAESLLHFARRETTAPMSALAMQAFAGSGRSSHPLVDRVRRLVLPDDRPAVRLPWYSLIGLLLASVLLLSGVQAATDLTVTTIAQALTAHERMQHLQEVRQANRPAIEDRAYGDEANLTVSGRVRTADGEPLPDDVTVSIRSEVPRGSAFHGISVRDGSFTHGSIQYGQVSVAAWAEGYAPTVVGPFTTEPGGTIENVEVVLSEGFTGRLRLLAADGEPVAGTTIDYFFWHDGSSTARGSATTDEAGVARIANAVAWPCRVTVEVDGYEFEQKRVTLNPDEPLTWRLTPARPASGTVVSRLTGQPIEGATVWLVRRGDHTVDPRDEYRRRQGPAATTGPDGMFELTTLRADTNYTFLVEAPGHGPMLTRAIEAGERGLTIRLGDERYVAGRIVGDLNALPEHGGERTLSYRNPIVASYTSIHRAAVAEDGTFRIDNLVPGKVTLMVGERSVELEVDEAVDDLVVDLTKEDEQTPLHLRRLVVNFAVAEGDPPPAGTVEVRSYHPRLGHRVETPELVDGRAEAAVHVGGQVVVRPKGTIGYWFAETRLREVAADDDPLELTIDPLPGGMLTGRVLNADGEPVRKELNLAVYVAEQPPLPGDERLGHMHNIGVTTSEDGSFMITPLPLGGRYAVGFLEGWAYVMSEPVSLDAAQPSREVTLQPGRLVDVPVQVLGPSGEPIANVPLDLNFLSPYSSHGRSPEPATDRDGRHTFEGLNSDAPGDYTLYINTRRDYQPQRHRLELNGQPLVVQLEEGQVLEGRVIDHETGWVVPGVEVLAYTRQAQQNEIHRYEAEAETDALGRFRFSNLADREYVIRVQGMQSVEGAEPPVARPGLDEDVDVEITIPEWRRDEVQPRRPIQ